MSTELVILSNHPILHHLLLLLPSIFSSIRVFSNESALYIKLPNYWSFSFSITPSMNMEYTNEYSRLISFKIDWFDHLSPGDFQESSPTSQFKSISSLALSLLYGPTLTSVCDYWKKNIALTIWTFVGKVMSLLFNMLPRFVIAFLPRNIFWFHVCSYFPQWFWSLRKQNLSLLPLFSFCLMKWWNWMPWS